MDRVWVASEGTMTGLAGGLHVGHKTNEVKEVAGTKFQEGFQ